MNNIIDTGIRTNGEFTVGYQRNGNGGCIPVINGKEEPSLIFGYCGDHDREACLNVIYEALMATGGNIPRTRMYLMNAMMTAAKEIKPDEAVMVDGNEILISYRQKKAYEGTTEIANLDDMTDCDLPGQAIKALLINRAQLVFSNREAERYDFEEDEDFEDEDFEDDEEY